MKVHYYFDWFEEPMSKELVETLLADIPERKSLVFIGSLPSDYEFNEEQLKIARDDWFIPAGIIFDEYHLIDYRIAKEEAHILLKDASAIFLLGGKATLQRAFLDEYELPAAIKESGAFAIMGVSAGAMNMSAKWISSKHINPNSARHTSGETKIYDALGLDNFAMEAHFDPENEALVKNDLLPLSQKIDVYAACYESTIRVKNSSIKVFGDVYLITGGKIEKQ